MMTEAEAKAALDAARARFNAVLEEYEAARVLRDAALAAWRDARTAADADRPKVVVKSGYYSTFEPYILVRRTKTTIWARRIGSSDESAVEFRLTRGTWCQRGGSSATLTPESVAALDSVVRT
jgi:hypothetical protein